MGGWHLTFLRNYKIVLCIVFTTVFVTFLLPRQNTWHTQLKGENIYLGWWFQRFQSKAGWFEGRNMAGGPGGGKLSTSWQPRSREIAKESEKMGPGTRYRAKGQAPAIYPDTCISVLYRPLNQSGRQLRFIIPTIIYPPPPCSSIWSSSYSTSFSTLGKTSRVFLLSAMLRESRTSSCFYFASI